MNKRKKLSIGDKSLHEVRITELDDGNLGEVQGGINWYDCTNPDSCGSTTNLLSCNNERVCFMEA